MKRGSRAKKERRQPNVAAQRRDVVLFLLWWSCRFGTSHTGSFRRSISSRRSGPLDSREDRNGHVRQIRAAHRHKIECKVGELIGFDELDRQWGLVCTWPWLQTSNL